ncbi:MAG TPA: nuclear transport factor 2 family protein [Mycobacterium sp.]|jgi:ketosteroid isomerase-like protein|nr:nuclear transport factor 2 family protein [Mycobacterium sp.]
MHPFRTAVESGRFDTIGELFAEDAVLHSPIAHHPYHGKDSIAMIIRAVANTLNDFRFTTEMRGEHDGDRALMFDATVDGLQIQGCDFVHTRADGLIDTITVMLRPLKAVSVFADKMRTELADVGTG